MHAEVTHALSRMLAALVTRHHPARSRSPPGRSVRPHGISSPSPGPQPPSSPPAPAAAPQPPSSPPAGPLPHPTNSLVEPGTGEPGTGEPGTVEPGTVEPGTQPRQHHPSRPHLLSLPSHLLTKIIHRCDRTIISRVCKAFLAIYPAAAPTTLRPDGPLNAPALLPAVSALLTRHAPSITALDLRHVGHLLTYPMLQTLVAGCPRLASLTIQDYPPAASLLFTSSLLANHQLTHLYITDCGPGISRACLRALHRSASLATLRSLTLELGSSAVRGRGPKPITLLTHLQHLTCLHLTGNFPDIEEEELLYGGWTALEATSALPVLQSLTLDGCFVIFNLAVEDCLPQHTQLTALSFHLSLWMIEQHMLTLDSDEVYTDLEPSLQAIAMLTRLEHLSLEGVWAYAEAITNMLAGLPSLSQLDLTARAFPRLQTLVDVQGSRLASLHLSSNVHGSDVEEYKGEDLLPLLQLSGTLKVLSLIQDVSLPCLQVISELTGLTKLRLASDEPSEEEEPFPQLVRPGRSAATSRSPSLSTLTALRDLSLRAGIGTWAAGSVEAAVQHLGPLTNLTALALTWCSLTDEVLVGGGWLTGLQELRSLDLGENALRWEGLQELGSLDLGENALRWEGLQVVRQLPCLTSLTLPLPEDPSQAVAKVKECLVPPPAALRRLWLEESGAGRL